MSDEKHARVFVYGIWGPNEWFADCTADEARARYHEMWPGWYGGIGKIVVSDDPDADLLPGFFEHADVDEEVTAP